jgi:hypothetical protein
LHRPDAIRFVLQTLFPVSGNTEVRDLFILCLCALQVEEGCGLAMADNVSAAVHQLLCFIDAETTLQRLLDCRQSVKLMAQLSGWGSTGASQRSKFDP